MPKLTKRIVENIAINPEREVFAWDAELCGFGVRVSPKGRRVYIVQYRTRDRRQRRRTIGAHGTLTTEQAREIARQWLADAYRGNDRAAVEDNARSAPTVRDLAGDYLTRHAEQFKRPRSVKDDRSMLTRSVLPRLGTLKVKDVSRRDVESLHQSLKHTPYRANRVLALLSKMMSLAVKWGWRTDNPVQGIGRFQEPKRERWLSSEELERLLAAFDDHPNQRAANAIRLMLLTGARRNELLSAEWDQFDLERGVWTKPTHATKQKRTEHVPLSEPALALLGAMKEKTGGPYVFPGDAPGKPLQDIKKFWRSVCNKAGIQGARLHDLRHTFASHLVSGGLSLPIVGRLLGHTQAATTSRYAHLSDDPLREAANQFGALLSRLGSRDEKHPPTDSDGSSEHTNN